LLIAAICPRYHCSTEHCVFSLVKVADVEHPPLR
jgi:hypothetical protein